MIFKGATYRKAPMVTVLRFDQGEVVFGRVVPQGKTCPQNGINLGRNWQRREYRAGPWIDTGEPVYAVPIPIVGRSLSNLVYGADGKMYLCFDAVCYSRPYKMSEEAKEQARALKTKKEQTPATL